MIRQIVLDTETTGLSADQGHRIIEIGCVELHNRMFTERYFHHYIDPERDIDAGAERVHGITRASLLGKPRFHEVAEALMSYIQGAELIIHNADFDLSFLNYELAQLGDQYQKIEAYCKVIDTLKLARKKHPGQKNNLDALCKRYQIDHARRTLHGALLDAQLLAEVYLAMTAGQEDLLGGTAGSSLNPLQDPATSQAIIRQEALPVIKATEEEQKAHEIFLQRLKKEANKDVVVW